ncbi:MAG TPA: radical SAM protein [Xanthobacteraceae bacterium]|nr:radical SAM protein [Xanthobacteraceae bacterium]
MAHGPLARANFASTSAHERNTARPVVLIGFRRAENLGLGYLASTLRARGYRVEILEFEDTVENIVAAVRRHDPILVGFSLIFQFYIERYAALIRTLRTHGVNAHFTIGGHFPTLSYRHTLDLIPELDSVVRFEGELTLLELVDALGLERDWRTIHGIAYRQHDGDIKTTDLRPLLADLDELPYPDRSIALPMTLGRRVVQMLASRGCIRTCSFCSIHMFYRSAPGKVVRTRKPAEVAREMRRLHEERGAAIFSFQDDDFPVYGRVWQRWTRELLAELYRNDLPGRIIWKINARADAVDAALFAEMRDAGMYMVYMGLESGSDEGLAALNKSITVEQNLAAVETLKNLGLVFDFGFMLLDPSSTFESVLDNVKFLRRIVGDGYMAAEFCRMIPYDGTPIKEQLAQEGRLRGDVCRPDYDFLDPRLTEFYVAVNELLNVTGWIHGLKALSPQIKYAWTEVAVIERLYPSVRDLPTYRAKLQGITRASNAVLCDVVEGLAHDFMAGRKLSYSQQALHEQCGRFVDDLLSSRNAFIRQGKAEIERALGDAVPQAAE